jgi:hypothetical protein
MLVSSWRPLRGSNLPPGRGLVCYCAMISLGEMAAYLPHKKGFAGYTTRFWHPAYVTQSLRILVLTGAVQHGFRAGMELPYEIPHRYSE